MMDRRATLAALLGLAAPPAFGAPVASVWSRGSHSAIRLVAGEREEVAGAVVMNAGLQFELKNGFHTYWREPGESGVPPVFDWSASHNVAGVEVLWPAPRRFRDANGFFIGYERGLLLPFRATLNDDAAARLVLKLDYAVCETICVPASGEAVLELDPVAGATSRFAGLIAEARAKVPVRAGPNEIRHGLAIHAARLMPSNPPVLEVEVTVPDNADPAGIDLFAEGPTGTMFGIASRRPGGSTAFGLPLMARPRKAGRGVVKLTLCAPAQAIETEFSLDLPGKTP